MSTKAIQSVDAATPVPSRRPTSLSGTWVHKPYDTPVLSPQEISSGEVTPTYLRLGVTPLDGDMLLPPSAAPRPSYNRTSGSNTPVPSTPLLAGCDAVSVHIPEGTFHGRALAGRCEFLVPPIISPIDHPTPNFPCFKLFLGQIRFEASSAEVRWIIRQTCGVTALKIEPRGMGCFLAYFRTQQEVIDVQSLHKRILFDITGIWFARNVTQTENMHAYVTQTLCNVGRGFRLPKDTMVVEEEKTRTAIRGQHYSNMAMSAPPRYEESPVTHPRGYHSVSSSPNAMYSSEGSLPPAYHAMEEELFCGCSM